MYTLCTDPVQVDGLLGSAPLAEGPQGVGRRFSDPSEQGEREVYGRFMLLPGAIPYGLGGFDSSERFSLPKVLSRL